MKYYKYSPVSSPSEDDDDEELSELAIVRAMTLKRLSSCRYRVDGNILKVRKSVIEH